MEFQGRSRSKRCDLTLTRDARSGLGVICHHRQRPFTRGRHVYKDTVIRHVWIAISQHKYWSEGTGCHHPSLSDMQIGEELA